MKPVVVEQVVKRFGRPPAQALALQGLSLELEAGSFLAVMGASGCGKSSLLHLMAGLTHPDSGSVTIGGQNLSQLGDGALSRYRRDHIGIVFQSFNLVPTLTAFQNVALPLQLAGRPGRQVRQRVENLIDRVGLSHRPNHRPAALSGGEQQRLAIARALAIEPVVILADEPTGNLDSTSAAKVCDLLKDLNTTEKTTIVLVTHDPNIATTAAEVAVMRDGRMVDRFARSQAPDAQSLSRRYHQILNASLQPAAGA